MGFQMEGIQIGHFETGPEDVSSFNLLEVGKKEKGPKK